MLLYCLKFKNNTEKGDQNVLETENCRTMLLSKYVVCGSIKSIFVKEQKASGLLKNIDINSPLSKIPLLGQILM